MAEPSAGLREWVSVESDDTTYLFDVGFLTSNWRCIYGEGCPGIDVDPAPERAEGCCRHGAYLSDDDDHQRVLDRAGCLTDTQWQNRASVDEIADAFETDDEGNRSTAVTDGACVFLNRPDFPGGAGCALHRAALDADERPLDWKPEVCWQIPLRIDHHRDDNDNDTYIVRDWRSRDWGEGGAEFHWWCVEDAQAFVDPEPVYRTLHAELTELVGETVYGELVAALRNRSEQVLPHPVLRRASAGKE